jgi:hypothetical protein
MNDRAEDERGGGPAVLAVAGLLLLILYPLSLGPAVWLDRRYDLPNFIEDPLEAMYAPLEWLADVCEPIDDGFDWYIDLWDE